MGVKPISWREKDRLREQYLRLMRARLGVQPNPRRIAGAMRQKMETGRSWICSQCNIMNDKLRCINCGANRFGGMFSSNMSIAEKQFRDMLHRRRA